MQKGAIYVVSTPIGNLKDITLRALDVLRDADFVLSEDTRETEKIFREYSINTPQISYREQNHVRVISHILDLLAAGNTLALVTDSGTPLVSDPGFKLVAEVLAAGHQVIAVPGASSVIAALTVSGLPSDKFSFLGFLPRTDGSRTKILKEYGSTESTLIILESPYRLLKLLENIKNTLGNRKCAVAGELTKLHEKIFRGTVDEIIELLSKQNIRGEFVVLVAKEDF